MAQAQHTGERPCFMRSVSRTIIRQPLQRLRWQLPSEAFFDCAQHDILNRLFAIAACTRRPVYDLSVAAVLREGYP